MNTDNISELVGETIISVEFSTEKIIFKTLSEKTYIIFFPTCDDERLLFEDIRGHLRDLFGSPIIYAEQQVNGVDIKHKRFPKDTKSLSSSKFKSISSSKFILMTNNGTVRIRWCAEPGKDMSLPITAFLRS